jgi:hypothetical protein
VTFTFFSVFKTEKLSDNIALTLHKALIRSHKDCGRLPDFEIEAPPPKKKVLSEIIPF